MVLRGDGEKIQRNPRSPVPLLSLISIIPSWNNSKFIVLVSKSLKKAQMPRWSVIGRFDVNTVSQTHMTELQQVLSRYDYLPLPARVDGTQLALRKYDAQGFVHCEVLAYRETKETGENLQTEVTKFIHILSQLRTELQRYPQSLCPTFQSPSISLFRKKAHVLTTESGHVLRCQITPLLIVRSDDFLPSVSDRAFAAPIVLVHSNQLDNVLIQQVRQVPHPHDLGSSTERLRRAFRNLGIVILLLPFIIGCAGFFLGIQSLPLVFLTILLGTLGSVSLLRKAMNNFTHFQSQNLIPIQSVHPIGGNESQLIQSELALETPLHQEILHANSPTTSTSSTTNRGVTCQNLSENAESKAVRPQR
jgi:hypothetical protein